ncbi:hypothetical protein AU476_14930 [Cupriavidus sp. UYMSc13B]|nr:hypothetical protein AU476_14930 [Cupriavidus sp. UYMSc13B]
MDMGPSAVMTLNAQASIRSASSLVASMKLWIRNDSVCTRPLLLTRSSRIAQAFRASHPKTGGQKAGCPQSQYASRRAVAVG